MINKKFNTATLELFGAIQIDDEKRSFKINDKNFKHFIRNGIIVDDRISVTSELHDLIIEMFGLSGKKVNFTFHKSWEKVANANIEDLVSEQILHYITTYGYEQLGIYNKDTVFIPREKLMKRKLSIDSIPLKVIRGLTKEEIKNEIIKLGSGVALSEDSLKSMMVIIVENDYKDIFNYIKNRELLSILYDYLGIAQKDPEEYLRYIIYALTKETLLIKNGVMTGKILSANQDDLDKLIKLAPKNLASIFLRYKPIFLAMKKVSKKNKKFFNQLRRKAVKQHVPLPEDYMNSITMRVRNGTLDIVEFRKRLETAPILRKIRLAYSLKYRSRDVDAIVYRIRNGKSYADDYNHPNDRKNYNEIYKIVKDSIVNALDVKGKTFYIPEGINYGVPASEKQFVGNIPAGTYIDVKNNMIFGVHWTDVGDKRIDLDLSLTGMKSKFGWDGRYRGDKKECLFSGDLTSAPAPLGASELFYVSNDIEDTLVKVNYFNHANGAGPVKTKLFVAFERPKNFGRNYMVNPNNIMLATDYSIKEKETMFGLILNVNNKRRFIFYNSTAGGSVTARNNESSAKTISFLKEYAASPISLNKMLKAAGANVITDVTDVKDYIDLSPNSITKNSILELFMERK